MGSKVIDVFSQEFQSEMPEFYVSTPSPHHTLFYCYSGQQERAIKAGKITGTCMSKVSKFMERWQKLWCDLWFTTGS